MPDALAVKFCDLRPVARLGLKITRSGRVEPDCSHLLDALDHLCHQVDGDPRVEREFYGATTPEAMVALAVDSGILIDADDFRALLRSGSTERWFVRGDDQSNPIAHLQSVFRV